MQQQPQQQTGEYASAEERFHGQKPWFVKKLPSRLEILEGSSFDMYCHVGGRGCKPWFVKPLPSTLEVGWGDNLETKCIVGTESGSETASNLSAGSMTSLSGISSAAGLKAAMEKKNSEKIKRPGKLVLP